MENNGESKYPEGIEIDDNKIIIDTDELDGFKLQNVSQGRISMESSVRKEIGIDKDGQVLVTHMAGNFFIGRALNQEQIDKMAIEDLKNL